MAQLALAEVRPDIDALPGFTRITQFAILTATGPHRGLAFQPLALTSDGLILDRRA